MTSSFLVYVRETSEEYPPSIRQDETVQQKTCTQHLSQIFPLYMESEVNCILSGCRGGSSLDRERVVKWAKRTKTEDVRLVYRLLPTIY
jgi:hypothetical protein